MQDKVVEIHQRARETYRDKGQKQELWGQGEKKEKVKVQKKSGGGDERKKTMHFNAEVEAVSLVGRAKALHANGRFINK